MKNISKYLPKEVVEDSVGKISLEELKSLIEELKQIDLDSFELSESSRKVWDNFISLVLLSLPVAVVNGVPPVYTPFAVILGMFVSFTAIYGEQGWPRGFLDFLISARDMELKLIVSTLNILPDLEKVINEVEFKEGFDNQIEFPVNPILN